MELRRMIDEIHLQYPFMGSRRIRTELAKKARHVNRKRIVRIMREMDLSQTQNNTGEQSTQGLSLPAA